jgi:hypothetical protein
LQAYPSASLVKVLNLLKIRLDGINLKIILHLNRERNGNVDVVVEKKSKMKIILLIS